MSANPNPNPTKPMKTDSLLAPGTTGYYGTYPATIIRHYAHNLYELRLPGGDCCTDLADFNPLPPKNTYYAYGLEALKGGSFYRSTGRKREAFAFYNLGDFVGFVKALPDHSFPIILDRETAKDFLPYFLR
jgi:hypothetical protein